MYFKRQIIESTTLPMINWCAWLLCFFLFAENVVDELLKNLGQVSVITGTLKISRSFPIISLDFFKSLTEVQGITTKDSPTSVTKVQYSLEILENENLQKLFPTDSKVIFFFIFSNEFTNLTSFLLSWIDASFQSCNSSSL